ncbi:MAG: precorrin-6A/cobalt-precorrin-6A reductase, partial [Pseudomonadota bacterium]
RWHWVDDLGRVGALTGPDATLFLATGRQSLAAFSALPNRLWCRVIDPPGDPFPGRGGWIEGRPPFSVADEIALFQRLGIDWLVTKNSGGEAPVSKLVAARDLGLPVAIQRRPPLPPGITRVRTPEEALAWLDPA